MICHVLRGRLAKFTHESKFDHNINTIKLAQEAIVEGDALRRSLIGRRILVSQVKKDEWELRNAFRL